MSEQSPPNVLNSIRSPTPLTKSLQPLTVWIPDALEKHIYKSVITIALNSVYSAVACLHGTELVAHHVELELEKCDTISDRKQECINVKNLEIITEKLAGNRLLLPYMPRFLKKKMFFNIMQLTLIIMHIVLKATELDVLGHKIAVAFSPAPAVSVDQMPNSSVDPQCITAYVDECIANADTNIWFIPDFIEKPMLFAIYFMATSVIEEVFVDLRINVLGDQIKFNLVRGEMPKAVDMTDEDLERHMHKLKDEKMALTDQVEKLKLLLFSESLDKSISVSVPP